MISDLHTRLMVLNTMAIILLPTFDLNIYANENEDNAIRYSRTNRASDWSWMYGDDRI
jgi:hypothetical protein